MSKYNLIQYLKFYMDADQLNVKFSFV